MWKRPWEARESTTVPLPNLSDLSSDEEEEVMERVTLGDYGILDNLDEVAQGFQPVNPVFFNINNSVPTALKDNQYSSKEDEDCNIHLTDFLEACNTINPEGVLKSDKRLKLFGYSLKGRAKDWLNALPSGSIAIWDQLKRAFRRCFFPISMYMAKR